MSETPALRARTMSPTDAATLKRKTFAALVGGAR